MAGEDNHDSGSDGLRRAKRWLEFTTRVESWTHQDHPMSELLEFHWPHGPGAFTFDMGGKFRGGDLDHQAFLAEVKKYKKESDLPTHFRNFLAKCYVALNNHPKRCDNFLWISWSPFQAQKWDEHATTANVRRSVLHKDRVADRVWLITLSTRQERLVLSDEDYGEVLQLITQKGAAW